MQLIDIDLQSVFDYKYCFNPALIKTPENNFQLVLRLQDHESEGFLGVCTMDTQLKSVLNSTIIRNSPVSQREVMLEDPRLIIVDNKVYVCYVEASAKALYNIYTVFGELKNGGISNAAVPDYKKNRLALNAVNNIDEHFKGILPQEKWMIEKNWQFFYHSGNWFFIYQANDKHEVAQFDPATGNVSGLFETYFESNWNYGRISGGANPVLKDGLYYSFFHSWTDWKNPVEVKNWQQRKYHVGVYVFESFPPFKVKKISMGPLLSGSDTDRIGPSGHSVVFPGSAIFDKSEQRWIIAIGWNDIESKVLYLTHDEVLGRLVDVQQVSAIKARSRDYMRSSAKKMKNLVRKIKSRL